MAGSFRYWIRNSLELRQQLSSEQHGITSAIREVLTKSVFSEEQGTP